MDVDDIYRDEASTASLSQWRGRPSLRLASLPSTPPPPTPLKYRDTNTLGNSKQWQHLHRRRGVVATARTAPTSPMRSRPRAVAMRRPLTPTASAAPPPHRPAPTQAEDDNVNSSGRSSPLVCGVPVAGGTRVRRVSDGEAGEAGEEASLAQSSRWVSFSFASALTSRRPSGSRPSSPSPRPRAAILPSNFPDLHLCEEEHTTPECVDATTRRSPTPTTPPLLSGRPPVVFPAAPEWAGEEEAGGDAENRPTARGRGSLLLTSTPVVPPTADAIYFPSPSAAAAALPAEGEGLAMRHSRGKRERSTVPSPLATSFVVPGRGSSCQGAAATVTGALSGRRDDGVEEATRPSTDPRWPRSPGGIEAARLEEGVERSFLGVVSTATMRPPGPTAEGGGSLVLVDGPTPTPWRGRLAAVATATAESNSRGSMVVDPRCSDAAVAPVALFADAPAGDSDGGSAQNGEGGEDDDTDGVVWRDSNRRDATGATACGAEDVTRMDQTASDGPGVDDGSLAVPNSCARPSEELMALIESAREEVRRASERILAALHAHRCARCDTTACVQRGNNDRTSGVSDDCTWIGDSLRLTLGRSSTGPSGDGSSSSPWVSKDSVVLRRDLAARAGCILRRLRGYDHNDVGTLPMAVVARVVRLVLFSDAAPDTPPACRGEGSANLSWGLASPSPVCGGTPGKKRARQDSRAAEESAMELCVRLWRCFREHFGERHAARRLGVCGGADAEGREEGNTRGGGGSQSPSHAFTTCFPRVRLRLTLPGQPSPPSPPLLDTRIDYNVFAASLAELN